jgi:putative PIN family toxin of toxin-antitoxin system
MPRPGNRVFFDTSVYVAALLSDDRAAAELLHLVEDDAIRMVISEEVVVEIDRVLSKKFPDRVYRSRELLKRLAPEIAPSPTSIQIKEFLDKLDGGDASILCSAHLAKVDAFVTWNTRDFMAHGVDKLVEFPIVVPADALKLFRKWIEPFLD